MHRADRAGLDALVEDPHLRAVADADDVAVDEDLVARAELADHCLRRGEGQAVLSHLRARLVLLRAVSLCQAPGQGRTGRSAP